MKRTLLSFSRWLHKWAGLILALQILFWILGGLIMSAIPLEKVHGKHLANREMPVELDNQAYQYSIQTLIESMEKPVLSVRLISYLNKPLYEITTTDERLVFDATVGQPAIVISQHAAEQIATQQYLGEGPVLSSQFNRQLPREAGSRDISHWQVTFDDTWDTTLYLDAFTGQVITVRSDIWRLFDFFWMLHIMDYDEREDFNNPLLISFAASALLFTVSGLVLLYQSFIPGWQQRRARKRRSQGV